jgi:hypothetical protein
MKNWKGEIRSRICRAQLLGPTKVHALYHTAISITIINASL